MGRLFGLILLVLGLGSMGAGVATAVYARGQEATLATSLDEQLNAIGEGATALTDARATVTSVRGTLNAVRATMDQTGPVLSQSVKLLTESSRLGGPLLTAAEDVAQDMARLAPKLRPFAKNNLAATSGQVARSLKEITVILDQLDQLAKSLDALRPHVAAVGATLGQIVKQMSSMDGHIPLLTARMLKIREDADAAAVARNLVRAAYGIALLLGLVGLSLFASGGLWMRRPVA